MANSELKALKLSREALWTAVAAATAFECRQPAPK